MKEGSMAQETCRFCDHAPFRLKAHRVRHERTRHRTETAEESSSRAPKKPRRRLTRRQLQGKRRKVRALGRLLDGAWPDQLLQELDERVAALRKFVGDLRAENRILLRDRNRFAQRWQRLAGMAKSLEKEDRMEATA